MTKGSLCTNDLLFIAAWWLVMENLILPPAFLDHSQYQSSQGRCFGADVKMERWCFGWKLLLSRGGENGAGPLNIGLRQ